MRPRLEPTHPLPKTLLMLADMVVPCNHLTRPAPHPPPPLPPRQTLLALADMVVPCNASFNTAWEVWLGTKPPRMMPLLNALEIEHYPCLQVWGLREAWGLGGRMPVSRRVFAHPRAPARRVRAAACQPPCPRTMRRRCRRRACCPTCTR
jgi:hypothetical protein